MRPRPALLAVTSLAITACSVLNAIEPVVEPPTFRVAAAREPELRLTPTGATLRLWADVGNPNPFRVVFSALQGSLSLEGTRAARLDFPWGMPLAAGQDTVVPMDVTVNFADLPGLGNVLRRAVTEGEVDYAVEGTVTLDAGMLGRPSFGPMQLMSGAVRTR